MGQAFRRAAGKLRSTTIDTTSPSSSAPCRYQNSSDRRPPVVPPDDRVHIHDKNDAGEVSAKSSPKVSEERDPTYEAMLSQMVGRITAKPGGKLEMGEERHLLKKRGKKEEKRKQEIQEMGLLHNCLPLPLLNSCKLLVFFPPWASCIAPNTTPFVLLYPKTKMKQKNFSEKPWEGEKDGRDARMMLHSSHEDRDARII